MLIVIIYIYSDHNKQSPSLGLPQELGRLISSNQLLLSLMAMKDLHGNKYDTVIPVISARNLVVAAPIAG